MHQAVIYAILKKSKSRRTSILPLTKPIKHIIYWWVLLIQPLKCIRRHEKCPKTGQNKCEDCTLPSNPVIYWPILENRRVGLYSGDSQIIQDSWLKWLELVNSFCYSWTKLMTSSQDCMLYQVTYIPGLRVSLVWTQWISWTFKRNTGSQLAPHASSRLYLETIMNFLRTRSWEVHVQETLGYILYF